MSSSWRSRRRWALSEVVVATSLAITMIAVGTGEIARQHAQLRVANEGARVRAALLATYEKLRVGLLEAPAAGQVVAVEQAPGSVAELRLELVGLGGVLQGEGAEPGVILVEVRATWASGLDGASRQQALTTLIKAGGPA